MRRVFRYELEVTDSMKAFQLRGEPFNFDTVEYNRIEFWVLAETTDTVKLRHLQVYGTGHEIPEDATHLGSCPRHSSGLVWHVFERHGGTSRNASINASAI